MTQDVWEEDLITFPYLMCNFAQQQFASSSGRAPFSLFTQVSGTDGCEIVLNLPASSSPSSSAAAGGSPAEFYTPKLSLPLLIVKSSAPTRLSSALFSRPEGLLTRRDIKEARKTGWNRRAPASSPPLPLGTRLSGRRAAVADPSVTAATASPAMPVYRADLHDDRTGLFGADP